MTNFSPDLNITLGIEEEYFLIDPETRGLISDPDPGILRKCVEYSGENKFVPEFLRSQIEANTKICSSIAEARRSVSEMRRTVRDAARSYGAEMIASSLHPKSSWNDQLITKGERYEALSTALQHSSRQLIVGGMHIHAGFGDADSRIQVMTALRRYLPVLLALSASSPFSESKLTGFKSHRTNLMGNLPRTGIPAAMQSMKQFEDLVADYLQMQFINDAREIWWDIRPSHSFPTIELRICDACPRIDDAMCIIALFACLVRSLATLQAQGALPPEPRQEIIAANKWLAQRYGVFALIGDTRDSGMVDIADAVERILMMVAKDAKALGCEAEIRHAHRILRDGSSADRQIDLVMLRKVEGDTMDTALNAVLDLIVKESADCGA